MVKTKNMYRWNQGKFIRGQEKVSSDHSKAHKGDDCFWVSLHGMAEASAFVDFILSGLIHFAFMSHKTSFLILSLLLLAKCMPILIEPKSKNLVGSVQIQHY